MIDRKYFKLDDITLEDIDIKDLISLTDRTISAVGGEFLCNCLKNLSIDENQLQERNRIKESLKSDKTFNDRLDKALEGLGSRADISIYEYISKVEGIPQKNIIPDVISAIMILTFFLMIFITGSKFFLAAFFFMIPVNMISYFNRKKDIVPFLNLFAYIIGFLKGASCVAKLLKGKEEFSKYGDVLTDDLSRFKKVKRFSFCLLAGRRAQGSILDMFLDYIRMLFHIDIIKFYTMRKSIYKNREKLVEMFDVVGLFDMMSGTVKFEKKLKYSCTPEFVTGNAAVLAAEDMYHPYLKEFVANSFDFDIPVLLTGSNATGKSTFLKACAVNLILARTLCVCAAKSFRTNITGIYTAISIKDSIENADSFYMAELKAVKRMIFKKHQGFTLLILDEPLKGTNTRERTAASEEILRYLANEKNLVLSASHDVILGERLSGEYTGYYFSESFNGDEPYFDYKLKKGICLKTNAIRLLDYLGFPKEITQKAMDNLSENRYDKR